LNVTVGWSNFLSAEIGASATLAGLIFVAVSINLSKILEFPGVPGRAAEALALLMGVLFVCTFGLAPNQSERSLGIEFLGVGSLLWIMTVILAVGQLRRKHPWRWLISRFALCQCATLSFCIAGIALLLGHPSGMDWLVPGCIFSFAASMTSAWVLMVELLR